MSQAVNKPHILLVDDDERLGELLTQFLIENDFFVSTVHSALEARQLMTKFLFDMLILDVMMPGEDGLSLISGIRQGSMEHREVPVLLLTAMGETEDRVMGLSRGADDYLSKPFDPRELLLRVRAILRRQQGGRDVKVLTMGDVTYDVATNRLVRGEQPIALTTVESNLLKVFCHYRGKPISREELVQAYEGELNPRTVDVQITRLRRKIEGDPKIPRYLQTIRGKGYVLIPDA